MHENMKLSEGKNLTAKGSVGAGSATINVDGKWLDVILSGKPPMPESRMNRLRSDAKFLGNIFKKSAFLSHGYGGLDVPTQRVVLHRVKSCLLYTSRCV